MNKVLLTLAAAVAMCFTACAQNKEKQAAENETRTLVAYFSATGTTAKAARVIADATGGTLYEIAPQEVYSGADLNWRDEQSRSSVEMKDPEARPAMKKQGQDPDDYDVVFIGYPIWWNQAPRIINTFIESNDLKGKTLVPFATSGGSGIENSVDSLKAAYPDLDWKEGKLLNRTGRDEVQNWANSYAKKK